MKKVIFIGGTSHSGSTILDLLLSNHPDALSLGEVRAVLKPRRPHHFEMRKNLNQSDKRWAKIIKEGKKHLFKNLFELYPDKRFFIDSSKDPTWITYQQKQLDKLDNVEYKNVLIYKTPLEFAYSLWKREIEKNWPRAWKHYYKYYFSMMNEYFVVSYKDVCSDTITHDKLKIFTAIKFDTEKIITQQENFFGSTNQNKIGDKTGFLKYSEIKDERLHQRVNRILDENRHIDKIYSFLKNNKNTLAVKSKTNFDGVTYSPLLKEVITQKKLLQQNYRRVFPDYAWQRRQLKNERK